MVFRINKDEETNTAICFAPVCGNCGKVLHTSVNYHEGRLYGIDFYTNEKYVMYREITPSHCPYCKVEFDRIIMPTELPYNNILKGEEQC